MSNATHTPGPWKIQHGTVVTFDQDGQCAQVCGHNAEANAALIAAAPELLEVLRVILDRATMPGYLRDKVREALAKL